MQRRRLDADGRPGAIRNSRSPSPNPASGGGDELTMQLKRRTQMLEDVSGNYLYNGSITLVFAQQNLILVIL